MVVRKLRADQIFDGYRFLFDRVLVIREDGRVEEIIPVADAGGDIEKFDGILSPGLINGHCHLELSHMKGRIPEGTGLVDFVFKVVTERHFEEEKILDAIDKAEAEILNAG